MLYHKILASKLFDGYKFRNDDEVLILKNTSNGKIVETIINKEFAGDGIEEINGTICPGFINTHCHLELSYLKNKIPEKIGMINFLLAVMQNRNANKEEIEQAINDADNEMYNNGIVAVGDICNTNNSILQKTKSKINYINFIEATGFIPEIYKKNIVKLI